VSINKLVLGFLKTLKSYTSIAITEFQDSERQNNFSSFRSADFTPKGTPPELLRTVTRVRAIIGKLSWTEFEIDPFVSSSPLPWFGLYRSNICHTDAPNRFSDSFDLTDFLRSNGDREGVVGFTLTLFVSVWPLLG